MTVASARLGDPEAIRPALALRYDAWSHRRRTGEEAVAGLEAALGRDGIARLLGAEPARDPDPFVRRWAIDVAPPGAAAFAALTDPDWRVAEGAHEALLRAGDEVIAPLAAQAREGGSPPDLRARAILVLLRRGQVDLARQLWRELDARIALPGVPAAVRAAVLRAWLPGERGSDPRWQLEGELDLDPGAVQEPPEEILAAARSALAGTGLRVGDPIPIGEVREQGSGTYVHIPVEDVVFEVSELGRYYATLGEGPPRACEALGGTGFLFIDDTLGATRVGGLCVYYFGRRDPLRVHELLFYWQD